MQPPSDPRLILIFRLLAELHSDTQSMKELLGALWKKECESIGISKEDFIKDWEERIAKHRYQFLSLIENVDPALSAQVATLLQKGDKTFESE